MALCFEKAEFIRTASRREDFIRDRFPQLVFAGRSNVGKSSVINRLTGRRNLAYVGSSPGKTSQINYFRIDGCAYLVDLPGYGYAKVSRAERERWGRLMEDYFHDEDGLISLGVLIVDARHQPTADDRTMHNWFHESGCPEVVVANKLDKLKASEQLPALTRIRETLTMEESEPLVPFSAEKGTGREPLIRLLSDACSGQGL
jgi:GTP-binding protein